VLIVIDLSESRVHLHDPDDFGRFSVAVEGGGDRDDVARLVDQSGLGRLKDDGQHVVVDQVALRALAGAAATDEWDEGFAGMLAYAAGKGWVEDDGVVAHIEPRDQTA
jgi:hypothetical protein